MDSKKGRGRMMEVQAVSASAVERSCPSSSSEVSGHGMAGVGGMLSCRSCPHHPGTAAGAEPFAFETWARQPGGEWQRGDLV
jgi:hypothetical protein